MADFRESIRQIQAEMRQSQEEHFKKMELSFNFKDPEYPDGLMDGSSGIADHSFQTNSSTESSHNQPKNLNFLRINEDVPELSSPVPMKVESFGNFKIVEAEIKLVEDEETNPNKEIKLVEATYQLFDGSLHTHFSDPVVVKQIQDRSGFCAGPREITLIPL